VTLVSVIVPFHEQHAFVGDTLESIAQQRHHPLEVIVVDDGSATDPSFMLASWQARFARRGHTLRHVRQDHRGACAARNRGLVEARGELISFVDADDLLALDRIALLAAAFEPGIDAAIGTLAEIATRDGSYHVLRTRTPAPFDDIPTASLADDRVFGQAVMFRREAADALGPWDESLARWQDTNYLLRFLVREPRLAHVPDALTFWRCDKPADSSFEALAGAFVNVQILVEHLEQRGSLARHLPQLAACWRTLAVYGVEHKNVPFAHHCLRRTRTPDPRDPLPAPKIGEFARDVIGLAALSTRAATNRLRRERPLFTATSIAQLVTADRTTRLRWSTSG
jgi:hypothetical protein